MRMGLSLSVDEGSANASPAPAPANSVTRGAQPPPWRGARAPVPGAPKAPRPLEKGLATLAASLRSLLS